MLRAATEPKQVEGSFSSYVTLKSVMRPLPVPCRKSAWRSGQRPLPWGAQSTSHRPMNLVEAGAGGPDVLGSLRSMKAGTSRGTPALGSGLWPACRALFGQLYALPVRGGQNQGWRTERKESLLVTVPCRHFSLEPQKPLNCPLHIHYSFPSRL